MEAIIWRLVICAAMTTAGSCDLVNSTDCRAPGQITAFDTLIHHVNRSAAGRDGSPTTSGEVAMYVVREVLNCKPGKVRPMVEKFRALSQAVEDMGYEPLRLLTDVASEPFWTVVVEAKVERVDDFFALEQELMSNGSLRETMADYHDLIASGRREVYRIESDPTR
jgi:hypothetical protein